jgi:hypothetical protein
LQYISSLSVGGLKLDAWPLRDWNRFMNVERAVERFYARVWLTPGEREAIRRAVEQHAGALLENAEKEFPLAGSRRFSRSRRSSCISFQ